MGINHFYYLHPDIMKFGEDHHREDVLIIFLPRPQQRLTSFQRSHPVTIQRRH